MTVWTLGLRVKVYELHTKLFLESEMQVCADDERELSVDVHLFFSAPDPQNSVLAQKPIHQMTWISNKQRKCWVTSDDIAGCENQQSCNLEEISREGGITFLKDLQRQGKTWWKYDHGGKDLILFQIRKVNKKRKLRRARLGRDKWLSQRRKKW